MIYQYLFILISEVDSVMYYVLIICILYGIYLGIEEMNNCRRFNKNYKPSKNMVDFLLNNKS